MHHDYDYIIVGSGFGGSVSALRLAQKGYSVLVIEKGRRWAEECASAIAEEARWLVANYPQLPRRHRHFR